MNNESDELLRKITEWLKGQGYPLEMEVAAAFQNAGFTVSLSDWYKDFETSESREIDVTALQWSDMDQKTALQVCWRIECKLARERPWIIFTSTAQPERFVPFNIVASDKFRSVFLEKFKQGEFRSRIWGLSQFKLHRVGHGITQAFTTGQDVPYKAVMSSVKSAIDRVLQVNNLEELSRVKDKKQYWCIAFPVIVIDGKLFEYFVGDGVENKLIEIQSGSIYWKGANPTQTSPLVYIVTKSALNEFIQSAKETTETLIELTANTA